MQVVVDHLQGSRCGERQLLPAEARLGFGRHPKSAVAFAPDDDLDASSRHAELRPTDKGWVLVDLGSSNGTFVDGMRVTEVALRVGVPVTVQLGPKGPRVRLVVLGDSDVTSLAPLVLPLHPRPRWQLPVIIAVVALVIGLGLRLLWR